jgi:hypothetical protein
VSTNPHRAMAWAALAVVALALTAVGVLVRWCLS